MVIWPREARDLRESVCDGVSRNRYYDNFRSRGIPPVTAERSYLVTCGRPAAR